MLSKSILSTLFILFFRFFLFNQITIHVDQRVETTVTTLTFEQKKVNQVKISKTGYRIQICFDTQKEVVNKARIKFQNQFPTIGTYVKFEAPHYNLVVGDFQTLAEAKAIQKMIFGQFTISNIQTSYVNPPQKINSIEED